MADRYATPSIAPGKVQGTPHPGSIHITGEPVVALDDNLARTLAPALHYVHEWASYTVHCDGATRLEAGSVSIETIVPGVFPLTFENQIGLSRLVAFDFRDVPIATRHVEVISGKLGGPKRSLRFLRLLLAELTSERGAMAFLPRTATSRTVRSVQTPPSLLISYFFLLNNAHDIMDAVNHIERSPHRVLDDESRHVSIVDLTEIDPDVVLQLVQGNAAWDRSTSPPRLTAAPDGVWFRVPVEGFDSAENRFVKAVVSELAASCDAVMQASWLKNEVDPAVARRRSTNLGLRERLRKFERAPMFDDVGPMQRAPEASRVLQRRHGYRELNDAWQRFLQSREPVWQRLQRAIDLRDIATLYEYWVWFRLCREVEEAFSCAPPIIDAMKDEGPHHGLRARFPGLGKLTYNASRTAYSGLTLRPDYLWEPDTGRNVAFDAKFRLAWDTSPLDADSDASGGQAKAKADDLVKMHAYRDAIAGVRAAVVMYPGHVAEFRTIDREHRSRFTVAEVLNDDMQGVGGIPMTPEGWDDERTGE